MHPDWGFPAYECTGVIHGLVQSASNLHGWRIEDASGQYTCTVPTGQTFTDISPCRDGGFCTMSFDHYRVEVGQTRYGVADIAVLDDPLYHIPAR
jgi:hypothetical protein